MYKCTSFMNGISSTSATLAAALSQDTSLKIPGSVHLLSAECLG